jgi:DNA-binding response OmpR family regulator
MNRKISSLRYTQGDTVMKNILLVEDDADLNRAYSMILKHERYNLESAFNGNEALEILKTFKPDLILLDLIMPVMSGTEFLKEYFKSSSKKTKIIIITNLDGTSEVGEAITLGGYKCIVKSHTTPEGLKKIVKTTLKNQA